MGHERWGKLIPVGLVAASLGLGLISIWLTVADPSATVTTAPAAISDTTTSSISTLLIPPVTELAQPTTTGETSLTTPLATTTEPANTSTNPPATLSISAEAEATIMNLTSDLRLSLGVQPVAMEAGLTEYARAWALHMAEIEVLAHSDFGSLINGWNFVGENVGVGGNASAIFESLVNSEAHYPVLINLVFTAGGIGAVIDDEGRLWICQVFASRALPPTTLPSVTLPSVTLPSIPLPTLP